MTVWADRMDTTKQRQQRACCGCAQARHDLETWYAKVRIGGLVSGHDYQFMHQAMGDGYTFGVKDAIDEFAARRGIRVYQTTEMYLPSFYFIKC